MKKKILLIILVLFAFLPVNVFGAGGSFSVPSTLSITTNKTATFKVTASNCAGKFDLSSSDPSIAEINTKSIWLDNSSETITVAAYKAGTVKITIVPTDVTDYDENTVSGNKVITVTIKNPTTTTKKTTTTTKKTTTTLRTTAPTTQSTTVHRTTTGRTMIVDKTTTTQSTTNRVTTQTPITTFSVETTEYTERYTSNYATSVKRENGTTQVVYRPENPENTTNTVKSGVVHENGSSKIVYYDGYNAKENYYYTTKPVVVNNTTKLPLVLDDVIIDGFKVTFKNGIYYARVNQDTESVNIKAVHRDYLTVMGDGIRNLAPGVNNVELKVSDLSGHSQSVFVIITRPSGDDDFIARLAQLKLVGHEFEFDPNKFEYNVEVPSKTNDVYVMAIAAEPEDTVTGDGIAYLTKDKTDIIVTVSAGELGSNTYIIHVTKKSNYLMFILIISGLSLSIIGIGGYVIAKKKNWIAKTEEEKESILSNESKQVSVNGEIGINGEERKIGERIVKPTLVSAINETPQEKTVQVVTTAPKVQAARQVQTVQIHPDMAPKIVKTTESNPQVKVVPTHQTEEKRVITEQITTTINFDEN